MAETRRRRNPRGQGDKLRADIIDSASELLADPQAPPLTLRGVARKAGVAATSVYLHFDDIDALVLAVAEKHFGELLRAQEAACETAATPCEAVWATALAYCSFGLANPGLYQVMLAQPLPTTDLARIPGRVAFEQRTATVAQCLGIGQDSPLAIRVTAQIWQYLHGTVSLRISRPAVPWPPLDETVTEVVSRLLEREPADRAAIG